MSFDTDALISLELGMFCECAEPCVPRMMAKPASSLTSFMRLGAGEGIDDGLTRWIRVHLTWP